MLIFNYQYNQILKYIEINILKNDSIESINKINNMKLSKRYYSSENDFLKMMLMKYIKRTDIQFNKIIDIKNYIIDKILYYKKKNDIIISIISIIISLILIIVFYIIFNKYLLRMNSIKNNYKKFI